LASLSPPMTVGRRIRLELSLSPARFLRTSRIVGNGVPSLRPDPQSGHRAFEDRRRLQYGDATSAIAFRRSSSSAAQIFRRSIGMEAFTTCAADCFDAPQQIIGGL
jgi:hypothetical protein